MVSFEDHSLEIHSGDRIYMTSDGIGDQNNFERKRYSSKRLEAAILESVKLPMRNDVSTFMRNCEQRDDITVLGIEV